MLKQTYKNWKLIIVDDFSNSETKNILKKISKKNLEDY
ncbi:MAG: glycosyltransferase [Thermoproteota archaeon]|nr:glycosyltransferase [Thermoproteota archaeon]